MSDRDLRKLERAVAEGDAVAARRIRRALERRVAYRLPGAEASALAALEESSNTHSSMLGPIRYREAREDYDSRLKAGRGIEKHLVSAYPLALAWINRGLLSTQGLFLTGATPDFTCRCLEKEQQGGPVGFPVQAFVRTRLVLEKRLHLRSSPRRTRRGIVPEVTEWVCWDGMCRHCHTVHFFIRRRVHRTQFSQ